MYGTVYDFAVIETAGRTLGFSVVTYFLTDSCVVAGTITDLTADTGVLFYDAA
jgi:hypothetical protein